MISINEKLMIMLKDKNVYIINESDKFFYLQVDALIHKVGLSVYDICAIFISKDKSRKMIGYPGVEYINSQHVDMSQLIEAKTITTMSLNSFNSEYISSLIKFNANFLDKLYVFLTDDEVERWDVVYQREGELKESKKHHISHHDLFVLSKIKNFIGLVSIFSSIIRRLLGRDVKFIDVGVIFDILETKEHEKIIGNLISLKNNEVPRVWFHTKNLLRKDFFNFINVCSTLSKLYSNNVHFVVFANTSKSLFLVYMAVFFIEKTKGIKIKIDILSYTDPYNYMKKLMSCDYLFLQNRGGASTARTLAKSGGGLICLQDKSKNKDAFEKGYEIPVFIYDDYKSLGKDLISFKYNVQENSKHIKEKERSDIIKYKELYK